MHSEESPLLRLSWNWVLIRCNTVEWASTRCLQVCSVTMLSHCRDMSKNAFLINKRSSRWAFGNEYRNFDRRCMECWTQTMQPSEDTEEPQRTSASEGEGLEDGDE